MKSLSSAVLAQSFIPLRPFMGKLISLETADTGSRWMVITAERDEIPKTLRRGLMRGGKKKCCKTKRFTFKEIFLLNIINSNIVHLKAGGIYTLTSTLQLTEVVGDDQETLERLLGFSDEMNEIL